MRGGEHTLWHIQLKNVERCIILEMYCPDFFYIKDVINKIT